MEHINCSIFAIKKAADPAYPIKIGQLIIEPSTSPFCTAVVNQWSVDHLKENCTRMEYVVYTKNDTQKLHTTEMRMLKWTRGKIKKDHIKNEDIWREANRGPMTTFLRKRRLRWYGQERGGYHQEDVTHASARKEEGETHESLLLI